MFNLNLYSQNSNKRDNSIFYDSTLEYSALDSTIIKYDEFKISLYNKAFISYQEIELFANYIEINWETNMIYARPKTDSLNNIIEKIIFKENNNLYECEDLAYNYNTKKGKIKNMITHDGESYIHGNILKKNEDYFFIDDSKYTTCSHPDPHFYIKAKKIKVIPNEKIISGPANLVISDIPTPLLIPFGFFPIQNKKTSGFILPSYGNSINLGYFLRQGGWYFSVNDFFDLTLLGDIYTMGSWQLNSHMNYKKKYNYNGNFSLRYSKNIVGEKNLNNYINQTDFFLNWTHNQDNKSHPNRTFRASINAGSSSYNQLNSYQTNQYLQNTLNSNISYLYSSPNYPLNISANFRHSQNTLNNSVNLNLPDLNLNTNRITPFKRKNKIGKEKWYEKIYLNYSSNLRNQISTIDSLLFKKETIKKFNYGIIHRIPIKSTFKLFKNININPSINYSERWYNQRIEKNWDELNQLLITDTLNGFRAVRDFNTSLNINTKLFGLYKFNSKRFIALRHIFTPNISLTYRPDFSNKRWKYYDNVQINSDGNNRQYSYFEQNIFSSAPSGEYKNINIGFDNNLELKIRKSNGEIKKIGILRNLNFNTNYNLAADSFKISNINFSGRTELFPKMMIKFNGTINPYKIDKNGNIINEYIFLDKISIGRLTFFNFAINWDLNNSKKTEVLKNEINNQNDLNQIDWIFENFNNYIDFNIPWNLSLDYKYSILKPAFEKNIIQTFNFNGNFKLTKKWNIGFNSGYDFNNNYLSYTSIDVYRDLHCWEMRFNWIPFGFHQSYNLTINVKSQVLQDLKLNKRRNFYDF